MRDVQRSCDLYQSHLILSVQLKLLHVYNLISVYTSLTMLCFIHQQNKKQNKNKKLSKHGRRSEAAVLIHKSEMSFVTHIECEHDNMICFKFAKDAVGSDRDLPIISI